MFSHDPDLTSDLEWLLESGVSGQAKSEALISALVAEFGAEVTRLSLALFTEAQTAQEATIEAFTAALSAPYHSESGVRAWFMRAALTRLNENESHFRQSSPAQGAYKAGSPSREKALDQAVLQAVSQQRFRARLILLLHHLLQWPLDQIAVALDVSESEVRLELEQIQNAVQAPTGFMGRPELEALLNRVLQERWPDIQLTNSQRASLSADILKNATLISASKRRKAAFFEILLVGTVILIVSGLFWGVNRAFPEPTPTQAALAQRTAAATTPPTVTTAPTATVQITLPSPTVEPTTARVITPTPANVYYQVMPGDTFPSIARRLNTTEEELQQLNRIAPGASLEAGELLLIPGGLSPEPITDINPANTSPSLQPLTLASPVSEIIGRTRSFGGSLWSTLWFDFEVVFNGPSAYNGPAAAHRVQAWLMNGAWQGRSSVSLVLAGPLGEDPHEVALWDQSGYNLAEPGKGSPWFSQDSERDRGRYLFTVLSQVLSSTSLLEEPVGQARYEKEGIDTVAGREALIVEKYDEHDRLIGRFWIDAVSGFPLGHQELDPETGKIELESRALGFEENPLLPGDLFDRNLPWRGGFALDSSGAPAPAQQPLGIIPAKEWRPLPTHTPSVPIEAARGQLTFQMPFPSDLFSNQMLRAELFIDNTFTGRVPIPSPFFTICVRSPDGRRLALSNLNPASNSPGSPGLIWFDLAEIQRFGSLESGISTGIFAFSPDSRWLAAHVFNRENPTGGSVVLIDTESGEIENLVRASSVSSLGWSPSGNNLAFLGGRGTIGNEPNEVFMTVIHVATKEIRFRDRIYLGQGRPQFAAEDEMLPALTDIGDIEFPEQMGDLDDCAAPPQS